MRTTEERELSLRDAEASFEEAAHIASLNGMTLKRHSYYHYALTNGVWLQNIYPGNQRLYWDRNMACPGFLNLPKPWRLIHVVKSAIKNARE